MKSQTWQEQKRENSSYTRIEKITQTPEDGFVSNRKHGASWFRDQDTGMFGRGKFKGQKTTITYWKSHTQKTRILFYVAYILVALVFSAILIGVISAQKDLDSVNKAKLIFTGVIAFFIYGFVKSIMHFKKQNKQREKEQMEEQHKKD